MRGFTRKNGRLALAAAAVLALGQVAVQKANATTVFDSGGFDTAGYSNAPGNTLYNQPSSGKAFGGFDTTNSTTSAITVSSTGGVSGNSAQITYTGSAGTGGDLGAAPQYPLPPAAGGSDIVATYGPLVTVTTDFKYSPVVGGTNATDGPFVGLNTIGNNGANRIAGVGVDTEGGYLEYYSPGTGIQLFDPSGSTDILAPDTYAHLTEAFNFTTQQVTESVSTLTGTQIASFTHSFSSPSFYAAYLFAGTTGGLNPTSDTANFDNYVITANSAVPEPASLGLLCLAGVGMLARRGRRSAVIA